MKAKKLNKLGFRFSDDLDINLFSLITENPDLIEDLSIRRRKSEYCTTSYRNTTPPSIDQRKLS